MTETISAIKSKTNNVRYQTVRQTTVATSTTEAAIITGIDCSWAEFKDLTIENEDAGIVQTVKVYKSNKATPTAIGAANWADDWEQIGTDITVAVSSTNGVQWTTPCLWVGVTATAASGTPDINCELVMKTA